MMRRWVRCVGCMLIVAALSGCATPERPRRRMSRERMRKMRARAIARDTAPPLGADAPNFTLQTPDGSRTVELASFRGTKPVVLVFGSYT